MQTTIKRSIRRKYHKLLSNSQKLEVSILVTTTTIGASSAMYAFLAATHIIHI
jgi:hypothetical protein